MSLKRMLCSAVLLHYQQTDNLFDSASRERERAVMCRTRYLVPPFLFQLTVFCSSSQTVRLFFSLSSFSFSRAGKTFRKGGEKNM